MSEGVYLVFSDPPPGVSQEDYRAWYEEHVAENIEAAGFVSGRRFGLHHAADRPGASDAQPGDAGGFSHLAVYETNAPLDDLRVALEARIASGAVVLPEWFSEIRFSSWYCTPLGDRQVPGGHD